MSTFFSDGLLRFLPFEFEVQDESHYGDLSDFLKVVAIPLNDFDDFIQDFTTIFDVDECAAKYLPYLAKMLNYPLSDRDDETSQRLQLKNAVEWYKRKGLEEGFRVLFYSLGYLCTLVPLWTKDYKSFHRYPGTFSPSIFKAAVHGGNLVMMTITEENRYMRVRINGGPETQFALSLGVNRTLASVVSEINDFVLPDATCHLDGFGYVVIETNIVGEEASIELVDVPHSTYSLLSLTPGKTFGIDYNVPLDWPELLENVGPGQPGWYRSPHFGIEVFSIKGYVTDPEEFSYIRSRIELIRPAHTVLEFIDYVKQIVDVMEVSESDLIGEIEPNFMERWPFPPCPDRGVMVEYEYIRDGLVPNRSVETNTLYRHKRDNRNDAHLRNEYEYEIFTVTREFPTGPPQMPRRDTPRYWREGVVYGDPTRAGCLLDTDPVELILSDFGLSDQETAEVYRDGGLFYRDNSSLTYLRDGSFSLLTWRGQTEFSRSDEDTAHPGFTRDDEKPGPIDTESGTLLFFRADLPGVYWRDLNSLTDPDALGPLEALPSPGEGGPSVGP